MIPNEEQHFWNNKKPSFNFFFISLAFLIVKPDTLSCVLAFGKGFVYFVQYIISN